MKAILSLVPEEEWSDPRLDLENTEARVIRAFEEEFLSGYKAEENLNFTVFENPEGESAALVFSGPILFSSICAHHLLPFSGSAFVAYLPGGHLVGISKLSRVVEMYARRLQVQERMASQIASFVQRNLESSFVAVTLRAKHSCMSCRGVRQGRAEMITTAIRPASSVSLSSPVRDEYFQTLSLADKE